MRDSKAFEQQIHRIHELLEESGAELICDDHMRDPDNLSQPRQIDIKIKRGGKLTHVECRDHQDRQDVQWIEELMGRRESLKPDGMIAVSASGFTAGALKKAKAHGTIPRQLRELTEREVKGWGRQMALTLFFYQYSELDLSLCFSSESILKLDTDVVASEFASYPGFQSVFNTAAEQLDTLNLMGSEGVGRSINFGFRLQLPGLKLAGETVVEVEFHGEAVLTSKDVVSLAVFAYEEPEDASDQQKVTVEALSLGRTSIIRNRERISVFVDISQVEMPPFCQFRFFRLTIQDEVEHDSVELAGLDRLWVPLGKMKINICSV